MNHTGKQIHFFALTSFDETHPTPYPQKHKLKTLLGMTTQPPFINPIKVKPREKLGEVTASRSITRRSCRRFATTSSVCFDFSPGGLKVWLGVRPRLSYTVGTWPFCGVRERLSCLNPLIHVTGLGSASARTNPRIKLANSTGVSGWRTRGPPALQGV